MASDAEDTGDIIVHLRWPNAEPEAPEAPGLRGAQAGPATTRATAFRGPDSRGREQPLGPDLGRRQDLLAAGRARAEPQPAQVLDWAALKTIAVEMNELAGAAVQLEELAGGAAGLDRDLTVQMTQHMAYMANVAGELRERFETLAWRQEQMMRELREGIPGEVELRVTKAIAAHFEELSASVPATTAAQVERVVESHLDKVATQLFAEASIAHRWAVQELCAVAENQLAASRAPEATPSELRDQVASLVEDQVGLIVSRLSAELVPVLAAQLEPVLDTVVARRLASLAPVVQPVAPGPGGQLGQPSGLVDKELDRSPEQLEPEPGAAVPAQRAPAPKRVFRSYGPRAPGL